MKYRFIILAILPFWILNLHAQDTITVMQYNLLEYGNYNSGWANCFESNNNTQEKDEGIRAIMDYVQPDILTVNEFGATQTILNNFIQHNLNSYWKSDNIINHAGSNIINHIFYDSRKMELKKHVALGTSPRDTDVYELYLKTNGLISGDTIKLICVVAHLKAGQGYESSRRACLQTAMDHINLYYPNDNVLIMGDFNMYSSDESGYRLLTQTYSNPDIRFVDPLGYVGGVGNWHENSQFKNFHTQSTLGWTDNDCRSGGGLDDRFDFILMSDEIYMGYNKIRYVSNSFKAIGNDGEHFNLSVDQYGNQSVPENVLESLITVSDHLPVTMKMAIYSNLGTDEMAMGDALKVYPNPTDGMITVETCHGAFVEAVHAPSLQGQMEYRITNVMGQTMMRGQIANTIDVSALPNGLYFISTGGYVGKFVKTSSF